jgi:iron complex outermembrane receptor protein
MHPRCSLAAGALALLAVLPAIAADRESEIVVVTATRFSEADPAVAANISVITRQDIRNSAAQSLPDVLSIRAGISVSQLGGAMGRNAKVDMRGFGESATSNTLILIDGLRVSPIDLGSIIWSAIPLESVERIEIIRGSGTVLYGDGATGGVINIITNKSGLPVAGITATLGSFGYKSTDLQLANGNDKAYYNLFVNYADADGYRKNSQQDQKAASGRVGWLLDRGEVFADFAVYKESAGQPGSLYSSAYHNDPRSAKNPRDTEERDGYRIRPGIAYRLNDRLTLEAEVAFEHQQLNSIYPSLAAGSASERVRETTAITPRLRWRHDLGALPSETVIGFDHYDGKFDADYTKYANGGASQQSLAIYVQNVTRFTHNLSLTVGGRSQRMEQDAHQDAYAPFGMGALKGNSARTKEAYDIGLAYAVDGWRVYGKSGTTFRFANLDELFGSDPATGQPLFAGDLKPQHGAINEVGGSAVLGPVKLRASLYRLDLTDEIGYDEVVFANANLDQTRRKGAELEADWKISDSWQAKTTYAYTDAKFRDGANSGKELPLVARNQASAQLTWNTGATGNYTALARYVGERRYAGDFANTQKMLAAYTTFDLQATWAFKPWKLTAKVLNAFDKKYSSFAGYRASANDTYYYPADARSFFVSGRYDF